MVYTMKNPPKYFEDRVVGHFRKRVHDILLACQAHINGQQVGCLVSTSCKYGWGSSLEFRNDVASCIKPLVNAFYKIRAKEAQQFLYLRFKKTPVPAYEPPENDIASMRGTRGAKLRGSDTLDKHDSFNKKRKEDIIVLIAETTFHGEGGGRLVEGGGRGGGRVGGGGWIAVWVEDRRRRGNKCIKCKIYNTMEN
ncbi:hypothetical protein Tco_1031994 [Tanacetum coccineum]|uniref:Uncharacterized protein n=1 Tax=Tanacetum coccineum TaxID=301880 RepID=A0ABQ5GBM0_9ASTR